MDYIGVFIFTSQFIVQSFNNRSYHIQNNYICSQSAEPPISIKLNGSELKYSEKIVNETGSPNTIHCYLTFNKQVFFEAIIPKTETRFNISAPIYVPRMKTIIDERGRHHPSIEFAHQVLAFLLPSKWNSLTLEDNFAEFVNDWYGL